LVLGVLAAATFVMTLDTSVMNVSIASVANDLGTTVQGIQGAITWYTLVMASLMITGGKLGARFGRRKIFGIGLAIYACGSLTTALSPSLGVLMFGWSFLEGVGAALILPAIVALVASNFAPAERPRTYGLMAAASALAISAGPLIGGAVTTFASWRWVFVAEVVIVVGIFPFLRKIKDVAPVAQGRFDYLGAVLTVVGLALLVLAVLRAPEWGWVQPKPGAPSVLGISPVVWLLIASIIVLSGFFEYERHRSAMKRDVMVQPKMLEVLQLRAGLLAFFLQYLAQMAIFFTVPLYLSVVLELTALQTGIRLVPLSLALLLGAALTPKLGAKVASVHLARLGFALMLLGTLSFMTSISPQSGAEIVALPMLLIGLGMGILASQLGAITVASVPDSEAADVGGLQNTVTNFGASLGTAIAGAVLITQLSHHALVNLPGTNMSSYAQKSVTVQLEQGVPFISNSQLRAVLSPAYPPGEVEAMVQLNTTSRIGALHDALAVIAVVEAGAILLVGRLPKRPVAELTPPPEPQLA